MGLCYPSPPKTSKNFKLKNKQLCDHITHPLKNPASTRVNKADVCPRPQADASLAEVGRPDSTPLRVKVRAGAGLAQHRLPLDHRPPRTLPQAERHRDQAHAVLADRLTDIGLRHRHTVRKSYMPYVVNAWGGVWGQGRSGRGGLVLRWCWVLDKDQWGVWLNSGGFA